MQPIDWPVLLQIAQRLEANQIPYAFVGETALFLHGVGVRPTQAEVAVQWDLFPTAHTLFQGGEIAHSPGRASFTAQVDHLPITIHCVYNSVVEADPDRAGVTQNQRTLFATSVAAYRRTANPVDPNLQAIDEYLAQAQTAHSRTNEAAWNQSTYDAWVARYGAPNQAAARIAKDPEARLTPLQSYLLPLAGKRVINLLGSHGSKAVAMALLGASVTVVDISPGNAAYANGVAAAAGVPLHYIVSDVLRLPPHERTGDYDLVLMELGILHYFIDLKPLARLIADLLRPGGKLVLQDFHPVSTKLITSTGKKHKVTGNYFAANLVEQEVAYTKYLPVEQRASLKKVLHRKWTLGEVITAIAGAGLFIRTLTEEPNTKADDTGIPKTFTIVAERL
jgi:SAM-dependent methyltransferase